MKANRGVRTADRKKKRREKTQIRVIVGFWGTTINQARPDSGCLFIGETGKLWGGEL